MTTQSRQENDLNSALMSALHFRLCSNRHISKYSKLSDNGRLLSIQVQRYSEEISDLLHYLFTEHTGAALLFLPSPTQELICERNRKIIDGFRFVWGLTAAFAVREF